MALPVCTITSTTATGDVVVGPGAITYVANGLPISCIGDAVTGGVCVGAITSTTSLLIANGRPVSTLTSVVNGVNPVTGVPVATTAVMTVAVTDIK